ncbi:hypothetical protein SDC9_105834 [bioreactor metagenome]|uniref:Lipoprotein n=1 Tax=bioreactor metagenome TaxID=1076179 RepID=A0A645B0P4_9ZZZZ
MKVKLFSLVLLLTLSACATKIPFEQTCLTCVQSQRLNCKGTDCPETVMSGSDCIALMDETGEKISMSYILQEEGIALQKGIPLTLAKVRGRYFVTGRDFKNLWILTPSNNTAKVKCILLPESNLKLPPVFELTDGNLLMRGEKREYSYVYDIDNEKWIKYTSKAGE